MRRVRYFALVAALMLVIAACGDDDAATTTDAPATTVASATTDAPATTQAADDHDDDDGDQDEAGLSIDAPAAAITVDGDVSDWDGIDGLEMTLVGIEGEDVDDVVADVKVAHDGEFLYMLFSVSDDYDFNIDDHKFSPAIGVMWAIDSGAGPAMGATEDDQDTSLGLVDIWHWELDCVAGEGQGGRVGGPGEGKPLGNDDACNFDDEYSTDPETREDDGNDGEAGAENSLLGVFTHSNPVADGEGTWYFEMSRPLQTGDAQDAQFTVGGTVLLAMAYWDPDNSVEGWDDATHAVSSIDGWIQVTLQRN
ncbi:MAG: ethylbenzene dehydrogenase-related protein [Acidimicrobiia bacterium]